MGMLYSVIVPCPKCGRDVEFQSKEGPRTLKKYTLDSVPETIALNIDGHSKECKCGNRITLGFPNGTPKPTHLTMCITNPQPVPNATDIDNETKVQEKIIKLIDEFVGCDIDQVNRDTQLKSMGFDSLDEIELIMAVEEDFEIEIDDEEAEKLQTIGECVKLVITKVANTKHR